jgi:hypothetical protein
MYAASALNTDRLEIARRYADPNTWHIQPRFERAARWYHRIADAHTAGAEVWLLTWLPGQGTELHDHGGSAGAFIVVSGELTEYTVSGGREHGQIYRHGEGHRFGEHYVHRVVNGGSTPAISVHAYAPALRTMTRYAIDNGTLRAIAIDAAGVQW